MKRQRKRFLSIVLIMVMVFSLCFPASVASALSGDSSVIVESTAGETHVNVQGAEEDTTESNAEGVETESETVIEGETETDVETETETDAETETETDTETESETETETDTETESETETETDTETENTISYVAEYNGAHYESLQSAFDAVSDVYKANAPSGEMEASSVITLLADVTENVELSLVPASAGWSNVNLTLNLNGFTLYGTGDTSSTKGVFYLNRSTSYSGTYLYFTVKDGTITNGYSSSYAGAIYGVGSYVYVTCENVSFINNTGKSAGAVYSKSVTLNDCVFIGNTGTGSSSGAGAIYSPSGCILSMTNCTITGNSGVKGGGVYIGRAASSNTTFAVDSSNEIHDNTASIAGDDIYLLAASGSKTLTVTLPSASSLRGGGNAALYEDGTYDDTDIGEGTRYSEGNLTEITDSVELCYVATSELLRSMGIKVASIVTNYTVTYTDGTGEEMYFENETYTVTEGESTPGFQGDTSREGYVFVGWEPDVSDTVTADAIYTAQWKQIFTVTYTDGSENEDYFENETYSITEGESTPEFQGSTDREHYTFEGWNPELAETVTEDATYTAVWTENQYTITLYLNGGELGENVDEVLTVTYGTVLTELPTPVRDGYVFAGWYDADGNEYTIESVYELDEDLTLTAQWSVVVARYESTGESFTTLQAAFDAVGEAWNEAAPDGTFEESSTITLLTDVTEDISFSITPTSGSWSNLDLTLDLNGNTMSGTGDSSTTKGAIWLYRGSSYTGGGYLYFTAKDGTITGGYSTSYAGAVYFSGTTYGTLTFENVIFTGNTGSGAGAVSGGKSITASNCTFTDNVATSSTGAGAISSAAGTTLTLTNCVITGNSGGNGGGIKALRAASSNTTLDLASGNNVIYGNTASNAGDDIFVTASSGSKTLTVSLADASALAGGKAAELYEDGSLATSTVADGSRYADGNNTVISGSVQLCYSSSSELNRSIGIKVVPTIYTVTYTDGTGSETYFPDETYMVEPGATTPAFQGNTPRDGYTFLGWDPEVEDTVTADVIYTAQWTYYYYPTTTITSSDVESMSIRAYFIGTDVLTSTGELLSLIPSKAKGDSVSSYEIGEVYGDLENGYFIDITFHFVSGDEYESVASDTFNTNSNLASAYSGQIETFYGDWIYDFDYAEGYGADQTAVLYWRVIESTGRGSWVLWDTEEQDVKSTNITASIATVIKVYLTLPEYTVIYTDGSDSEEYFSDQVYTVNNGNETPSYDGEPSREGYTFEGWEPEVEETVTDNITYTAKWTITTVDAPEIVSVYSVDQTTIKITWTAIANAAGYQIFRAIEKEGTYECVKTITGGDITSYRNSVSDEAETYYYKVRAYAIGGGNSWVYSDFSEIRYIPATVVFEQLYSNATDRIRIIWNEVDGADGYQIWRADSADGTYSIAKTITNGGITAYNNIDSENLEAGNTYYYKMRAYIVVNGVQIFGAFSDVATAVVMPNTPEVTIVSYTMGIAKISWNEVNGAAGYQIWRATSEDGIYELVKSITDSSTIAYSNTGLESGSTYYYKIRAYAEVGENKTFGGFSDVKYVTIK